jgi:selenocysteine lyase/cysteine desulfurase
MDSEMAAPATSKTLTIQRDLFDIPRTITYLNCANASPQLRSVTAAGVAAVHAQATPWTKGSEDWFAPSERLRALFAQIINGDADGVAFVPSVSYGIALAAANVDIRHGQTILLLDGEFPSNFYEWGELARRRGASVRTVTRESDEAWADSIIGAISPETAVVSVPNCHWTDGSYVDLASVAEAVHSVGAAFVIDASQSVGAYPLDVSLIQPDFLVSVGYKWLMGPYGLGYLYVAPRWRETGIPLEHSWLSRAGAEDFTRLSQYADSYRHGARRFDMGEFPQFVLTPMAIAALEQVLTWGVDRIQTTVARLVRQVEQGAVEIGATAVAEPDRVGHIMGIRPQTGVRRELVAALTAANVYVSVRGTSLRVAPHLYNDDADISRLLEVLRRETQAT